MSELSKIELFEQEKKRILELGYKRYQPSVFDNHGITDKYQKCMRDKNGIQYYITVSEWHLKGPAEFGDEPAFEYSIVLFDKESDDPVSISFYAGWNIDKVEKRAKDIFDLGCWRYDG